MNPDPAESIYQIATGGDTEAMAFLRLWANYCHRIDDIIDKPVKNPDDFLEALALANVLYSSNFYQRAPQALRMAVLLCTNDFEDSVSWENSTVEWQKRWSDVLRFAGNHMVLVVAFVCGGYARGREVSLLLREDSWKHHHSPVDGTPE